MNSPETIAIGRDDRYLGLAGSCAPDERVTLAKPSATPTGSPLMRDAANDEALEDHEEQEDRQQRKDRHGEHLPVLGDAVLALNTARRQRHRVVLDVVEINERPEEIVPGPDEGKDRGRGHRRDQSGMMIAQ